MSLSQEAQSRSRESEMKKKRKQVRGAECWTELSLRPTVDSLRKQVLDDAEWSHRGLWRAGDFAQLLPSPVPMFLESKGR